MFQYTPVAEEIQSKAATNDFGRLTDVLYVDPAPIFQDYHPRPCRVSERYRGHDQAIKDFKVRDDDVYVISHPKTGTTMLSELVTVLLNGMDFSKIPEIPLAVRSPYIELSALTHIPYDCLALCNGLTGRRAIKTHLPMNLLPTEMLSKDSHKMIYTARNPKDAAVSSFHHFKNLCGFAGSLEDHLDLYLTGDYIYGSYFQHVEEFLRLSKVKDNLLFLTFEDMVSDMPRVVKQVSQFIGISLSEDDVQKVAEYMHFDKMKGRPNSNNQGLTEAAARINGGSVDFKFMRKGKKGSHKEEMTQEYIDQFEREMVKWPGMMEVYPNY